jgi:hypothetical protein
VTRRRDVFIAWSLWGATVALAIGSFLVGIPFDAVIDLDPVVLAFLLFLVSFSCVGTLVALRLPRNPIGWLMSLAALSYAIGGFSVSYFESVAPEPSSVLGRLFVGVGMWSWNIGIGLAGVFLVLLFPSGRLPSRRWRPVAWAAGAGIVLLTASVFLTPGPFEDSDVVNPLGIRGAGAILEFVGVVGLGMVIFALLGAVVSVVVRFRCSKGVERLQLKWLTFAGALVATCIVVAVPLEAAAASSETATDISNFVITASLSTIPLAVGVAILRYRLYDIDRIINHALVYGLISAILVVGYAGLVLLLQALLPVTNDSPVAVAASTLAMAALFGPLRGRVQREVDRRFYRSKFDAGRTIEEFGSRLRNETDLEALSADLIAVIRRTVQPSHASLWLAGPKGHR